MKFLKQKLEENDQVRLFADVSAKHAESIKKKKKKTSLVALKSAAALTT